jgi:mannose-1-phosphate guanylyltransferase/phosphomannomutase
MLSSVTARSVPTSSPCSLAVLEEKRMRALILAAGEGTRLRPLTLERPKPMLPIGGRPILEHLIALLRRHGVTEIAINLHYRPDAILDHFGSGDSFGVSLTYSHEENLLGSAGAARRLAWFFDGPFLVLYGDVLTDLDLSALVNRHRATGAAVTLALYRVADPSRCGIVELTDDNRIRRFIEKPRPEQTFSDLANAGVYVVEPSVLAGVPAGRPFDFGLDLFPRLLERDFPLYGFCLPGYILDIGSIERYRQAEADLRAGAFRSPLSLSPV